MVQRGKEEQKSWKTGFQPALSICPRPTPGVSGGKVRASRFISACQLLDHCLLSWAISAYSAANQPPKQTRDLSLPAA